MSFGAAAGVRRPRAGSPCPCGSGAAYDACCGILHRGTPATTAEALMRSRYSAFAIGDAPYLLATWHPRTRPDDVTPDPSLVWTGLEIVGTPHGGTDDAEGVVEFRAHWRAAGARGTLHERSRFARLRGRWLYLDGEVS